MTYTIWDLLAFFLIYSFFGWVIEVGVMAIKERRFCNRGFLNLPVCLTYGISLDILILIFPTWRGNLLIQAVAVMAVTSAVEVLAGFMVKRIWKNTFSVFHAPYGSDDDNDLSDSAGDLYGGKSGAGNFAEGAVPDRNGYDRTGSVYCTVCSQEGNIQKESGKAEQKREESAGKLDLSECMGKTE